MARWLVRLARDRNLLSNAQLGFSSRSRGCRRWRSGRDDGHRAKSRSRGQESLPIHVVLEDVRPPVASVHDVVDGPWVLDSNLARHGPEDAGPASPVRPMLWFDHCYEKVVKAELIRLGWFLEKTHDLLRLARELEARGSALGTEVKPLGLDSCGRVFDHALSRL